MRKNVALGILVIAVLVVMGICSNSATAQEKEVTIRFANFFPPTHPCAKIFDEWGKEIEKRTAGKIRVRQYAGGTLTPAAQTYDSVVGGVVDAGNIVLGYTMGKFPLSEGLDLPLGVPNGYVATRMMNAYYEKFKPKELEEVKVLFLHAPPGGNLHTRSKQVHKLEDLKGLKIRTYGPNAKMMTLLGATPVAMPQGDAYDAISKGVVDGGLWTYEALQGWKIGEVVKYTTEIPKIVYTGVFVVAMNKKKWSSIAPEHQKTIDQINREWIEKHGRLWDSINEEGKSWCLKRGNTIMQLPPDEMNRWVAKIQPMLDEYVKNMKAKGLPGDAVLKFAQEYIKANPR